MLFQLNIDDLIIGIYWLVVAPMLLWLIWADFGIGIYQLVVAPMLSQQIMGAAASECVSLLLPRCFRNKSWELRHRYMLACCVPDALAAAASGAEGMHINSCCIQLKNGICREGFLLPGRSLTSELITCLPDPTTCPPDPIIRLYDLITDLITRLPDPITCPSDSITCTTDPV